MFNDKIKSVSYLHTQSANHAVLQCINYKVQYYITTSIKIYQQLSVLCTIVQVFYIIVYR